MFLDAQREVFDLEEEVGSVMMNLADLLSVSIQKRKNLESFVGCCQVSTVFSSRTVYTESTDSTTTKC